MNSESPKVSVVIPAYNEEKFLAFTLKAVLAMDYPDFEIIVVDNASSDNTAAIACSFSGVKVVHESRKGTNSARERGRQEATGEIIANIDADCMPDTWWLRRGVHTLTKKHAVGASGPYDYHDGSSFFRILSLYFQKTVYALTGAILSRVGKGTTFIGGNCIMRADALEKVGGYNTSLTFYGDDTDTAKRLARVGRVVFDGGLVMRTSWRRFHNIGVTKTSFLYVYHFLKILFKRD